MSDAVMDNGDRWTMLIPRGAFRGVRRFNEFQRGLGIARDDARVVERLARLPPRLAG